MDGQTSKHSVIAEVRLEVGDYSVVVKIVGRPSEVGEVPVEIEGACESFRGSFQATLRLGDLHRLRRALADLEETLGQDRAIEFSTEFPAVHLHFAADKTGHLQVRVRLTSMAWTTEGLTFAMPADQTFLLPWIEMLDEAVRALHA